MRGHSIAAARMSVWLGAVGLVAVAGLWGGAGLAGCAKPPPETRVWEGRAAVNQLLAAASDEPAITRFAGVPPSRCIESQPGAKLCEWRLDGRSQGWRSLASAIGASARINLLCELPTDGSPRSGSSCAAFPRRSDRSLYPMPSSQPKNARSRESKSEVKDRYRVASNQRLSRAGNLVQLSHLVGAIPSECRAVVAGQRECLWRTNNHTYGHGTLAVSIGASRGKKIRLLCDLPADGSPRASQSCRVEIGA